MSHSNASQAHDFYYLGVDEGRGKDYSGCTVSYEGNTAYSYSTAVAKVIPRRGVKPGDVRTRNASAGLTLLSFYPMSSTTAQHLSKLESASPFDVVHVPLHRGDRDFTPERLARAFAEELESYAAKLNKAENRLKFMTLLNSLHRLQQDACEKWARPLRSRALKKFDKLDVSKIAEEIKARNRKAAVKAAAETRAVFAKYLKDRCGRDYCDFMRSLFDRRFVSPEYHFTDEQRNLLRKKVCGGADRWLAYVWVADDEIRTSKNVVVPVKEAKVAMRLWAAGKDMRTLQVNGYTIVSYQGDTIQIGCHKIPRENMLALYEAVMGKPFPEKPESPATQEGA